LRVPNFKEFIDAIERLTGRSLRFGIILFAFWLVARATVKQEFFPQKAVESWVESAAGVAFVVSIVLFAIAGMDAIWRTLNYVPARIRSWENDKKAYNRLRQNLELASADALLLLVFFMRHSGGRFLSPGDIESIRLLRKLDLIESDRDYDGFFVAGNHYQEELRVAPAIYAKKAQIEPMLLEWLKSQYPDIDDKNKLAERAVHVAKYEYNNRLLSR
jgi:hypothetical protein